MVNEPDGGLLLSLKESIWKLSSIQDYISDRMKELEEDQDCCQVWKQDAIGELKLLEFLVLEN